MWRRRCRIAARRCATAQRLEAGSLPLSSERQLEARGHLIASRLHADVAANEAADFVGLRRALHDRFRRDTHAHLAGDGGDLYGTAVARRDPRSAHELEVSIATRRSESRR